MQGLVTITHSVLELQKERCKYRYAGLRGDLDRNIARLRTWLWMLAVISPGYFQRKTGVY